MDNKPVTWTQDMGSGHGLRTLPKKQTARLNDLGKPINPETSTGPH